MNDSHAETRPEHQRLFPTHVIDATYSFAQKSYSMHYSGFRWALETTFQLMAANRLNPAVAKDALAATMEAAIVANMTVIMAATLKDFNTANTVEEFIHKFGKVIHDSLGDTTRRDQAHLMLGLIHEEYEKFKKETATKESAQ